MRPKAIDSTLLQPAVRYFPEAGASGYLPNLFARPVDQFPLELPFFQEFSRQPAWLRYQPVFA